MGYRGRCRLLLRHLRRTGCGSGHDRVGTGSRGGLLAHHLRPLHDLDRLIGLRLGIDGQCQFGKHGGERDTERHRRDRSDGGSSFPQGWLRYKGGSAPEVRFEGFKGGKFNSFTLSGKSLIDAIREAHAIPQPKPLTPKKGEEVTATTSAGETVTGKVVDVTGNQHGTSVDVLTADGEIEKVPTTAVNQPEQPKAALVSVPVAAKEKEEETPKEFTETEKDYRGNGMVISKALNLDRAQRNVERRFASDRLRRWWRLRPWRRRVLYRRDAGADV